MSTRVVDEVPCDAVALDRFAGVAPDRQLERLDAAAERARRAMAGRTLWNLNSAAKGGGVAEMLTSQLPYLAGAGIDARWLVIDAGADFLTVSKRIHNQLHGNPGDGRGLDDHDHRTYEDTLAYNEPDIRSLIAPGDVVFLHDPQTAGLIPAAQAAGATVIWRCHVGVDDPNEHSRAAWDFLRPYVAVADRHVFTCRTHVWSGLDGDKTVIIPPSINPFSTKNQPLDADAVDAILATAGLLPPDATSATDDAIVRRRATVLGGPVPTSVPIVMQVSRWDRLKDPIGVLRGFADHIAGASDAHLVLAGPETDGVDDDPEQAQILDALKRAWEALDSSRRDRVHLATLPMADEDENALIVNALQRRSDIVVQKSLAEGFGLTVSEAMWKRRAVVASACGGIIEQVRDGETGVLVHDPTDGAELGRAVLPLLRDGDVGERLGAAAQAHVQEHFLTSRELAQQLELLEEVVAQSPS